jgi:hypothetical protein
MTTATIIHTHFGHWQHQLYQPDARPFVQDPPRHRTARQEMLAAERHARQRVGDRVVGKRRAWDFPVRSECQ